MSALGQYFQTLFDSFGRTWNQFWYASGDIYPLCVLRILIGIMAISYQLSFTADLTRWFSKDGLLPVETAQRLSGGDIPVGAFLPDSTYHYSYFNLVDSPTELLTLHFLGTFVLAVFILGWQTRIFSILSFVVVLSYIHRAPQLTGQFEPILAMMMFYLCLAPCGTFLSIDKRLTDGKATPASPKKPESSWISNISMRLMQIHLAGFYLVMGLTKLYGDAWLSGEAMWFLVAHTESRLIDLSFLHRSTYLVNAWTHAVLLFEICFALLIWNRQARPLLLIVAFGIWGSIALATGLVSYCVLMLVANLVFLDPKAFRKIFRRFQEEKTVSSVDEEAHQEVVHV